MAALTGEQKQRWLELIRQGWDRQEAAHAVGETASTFQTITFDDREFRQQMMVALNEGRIARKVNRWEPPLSQEQIDLFEEFLEMVRAGKHPTEAAHALGYYLSYFFQVTNPFSKYFDADLHERYKQADEEGHPLFMERLRRLWIQQAEEGEYRAVRDLGIMHLPEAAVLRSSRVEVGNADGQAFQTAVIGSLDLTGVPTELLLRLKADLAEIEQAKQKPELEPRLELLAGGEQQ